MIVVEAFPLRNHFSIALDKLEKMFILKLFIDEVSRLLYLSAILTHYRELFALILGYLYRVIIDGLVNTSSPFSDIIDFRLVSLYDPLLHFRTFW